MLTGAALMAALAVAAAPAGGATKPHHLDAKVAAGAKVSSGLGLGGITTQSWPVVVALNKARTRVDQLLVGLDMTCTSGDTFGTSDGYQALKLSKSGRFGTTFGRSGSMPAAFPLTSRARSSAGSPRAMRRRAASGA
jgi:hypothetical protein